MKAYYMKKLMFIIFFSALIWGNADAGEVIKKGDLLNLERCIETALSMQPDIIAAQNTVKANESRAGEAKADYYPQIDWSSAYNRRESLDQYANSLTLRQNIYDFGKTSSQIRIENLNLDSSKADLANVSAETVLKTKQAYYSVLKAKRNREVAEEAVKQFQQHLERAKGFYDAGLKPKIDVTRTEVDLSTAKLNLIKAANALKIAFAELNNAMGVPDAPEYDIEDSLSYQPEVISFEDAIARAYAKRPDLASVVLKKEASAKAIDLAKTGYYPSLTGNASYNRTDEEPPLDEEWSAGITLSFHIFSGFSTRYQVEEARANLNILSANEEALRQAIFLDIQQAYLNLKEAEESIPAAEAVVRHAEENLELANGRYAAGVGSPIEVTDAQVGLNSAKRSYIEALYDHKVALANLEKAMGGR
jgi:outer membrane protein TolC